jgi:hypothetical protein
MTSRRVAGLRGILVKHVRAEALRSIALGVYAELSVRRAREAVEFYAMRSSSGR